AYGYLKQDLFELIRDYYADARVRKKELLNNQDYLREVLQKGADKARAKAIGTLDVVRDRIGLRY
ncbi:MAG: tryptophan--tRNA ligase, partial [Candidatus Electrothrix sp. AR3]|nr:tryptophan--tRNA ligase [Candidatus Electrothrix sp. AR3]